MRRPAFRLAAIVALLCLAVAGAGRGEDDFPVRGRGNPPDRQGRPRPEEPAVGEPAERTGPFVLLLTNGDRITGRLVGIDAQHIRFRPDATGDVDLTVPLPKIEGLERSSPPAPVEPRGDRVYPAAGGLIHGTLTAIDDRRLAIDAHLVGPLELDLAGVAAFVRHDARQPERSAADTLHEVHESAGSRLVGKAAFQRNGVRVSAPGLSAEVGLREVTAILFPVAERTAAAEAERAAVCSLALMNGGEIVGTAPRLEEGRIVVGIGGGRTAAVPLDHLARAGFGGAPAGRRRVLLWTRCADQGEEAAHMAEALENGLPAGWKVVADADIDAAEKLGAALKTAGVLVVAEMENFDEDQLPDPGDLGLTLRAFLARGGTVVLAGVGDDANAYWGRTGLVSLSTVQRAEEGEEFALGRGHPLARGVGDSFAAVNGTHEYTTDDEALRPVASRDGGGAAVLVKKAGRGTIMVLGMDYYERTAAIDRLLVNAVTQGR